MTNSRRNIVSSDKPTNCAWPTNFCATLRLESLTSPIAAASAPAPISISPTSATYVPHPATDVSI